MARIYIELSVVCKTRNLQGLSILTGVSPSEEHNINDISKQGKLFDYSCWDYKTYPIETYYSEEASSLLIRTFEKCIERFREFILQYNCTVSICYVLGEINNIIPDLTIDKEMINFAAKLNAKIYFDGLGQLAAYLPGKNVSMQKG
jgi:hypothetical protein